MESSLTERRLGICDPSREIVGSQFAVEPEGQKDRQLELGRVARESSDLWFLEEFVEGYEQYLKDLDYDGGYERWFERQTDMFA